MKFLLKFLFVILALQAGLVFSQTTENKQNKGNPINWEMLSGEDSEFIIYMPQKYETLSDGNYFTGTSNGKVDKKLIIYRYINNVVLMMEYLSGDAKNIMKNLLEMEKYSYDGVKEINGFDFAEIISDSEGLYKKKQFYRVKNRVYLVQAISKTKDNEIADSFFNSLKLIHEEKAVSPNVPQNVKSVTLPTIYESEPVKLGDEKAIEAKEADRKEIVIHSPRPNLRTVNLRNASSGKVKLRILYSSSGKVTDVEILESSVKALEKPAIESAKNTIFIPAEKDGKLVSAYGTREYKIGVSTSFIIR